MITTPSADGADFNEDFNDELSEWEFFKISSKIKQDLLDAGKNLTPQEARYLVDNYYIYQENRKRGKSQVGAMKGEPVHALKWLSEINKTVEEILKKVLGIYAQQYKVGRWAMSQVGMGPVITAGLLAHIDITKAPTAGKIWRYAGLDPSQKWLGKEKSKKFVSEILPKGAKIDDEIYVKCAMVNNLPPDRFKAQVVDIATNRKTGTVAKITRDHLAKAMARTPWNPALKRLRWLAGDCFMKNHKKPKCFYGHLYAQRKLQDIEKNLKGEFAEVAEWELANKNYGKNTEAYKAYKQGKLPDARITARAKAYASKIFLAHFHHVWYESFYNKQPPKPYIIAHSDGKHTKMIEIPNWPMVDDAEAA